MLIQVAQFSFPFCNTSVKFLIFFRFISKCFFLMHYFYFIFYDMALLWNEFDLYWNFFLTNFNGQTVHSPSTSLKLFKKLNTSIIFRNLLAIKVCWVWQELDQKLFRSFVTNCKTLSLQTWVPKLNKSYYKLLLSNDWSTN